jgi:hypothetical protein
MFLKYIYRESFFYKMSYKQSIEDLLLILFIKSSHIFDDSDEEESGFENKNTLKKKIMWFFLD